jgi:flagellar hook-associated protein 2
MAGIPATGIGSGLDVQGLVSKLMAVEQQPITALDKKDGAVRVQISGFATYRGALASFQGSLVGLEDASAYTATSAAVGDASVAAASASDGADPGTHTLEVTDLAASQRLKSGTFKALTDTVGTGTITIKYGSYDDTSKTFTNNADRGSQNIVIDSAHSSLAGVRDAINAAKVGVTASVINDGSGFRLVVASNDTGTKNGMSISVADDDGAPLDAAGLSQLAYDPTLAAGPGKNMIQVAPPVDAKFLLDGIEITKSSNTVTDALSGTTLTLLKKNAGSPTTLSVGQDTSKVQTAVNAFIKAYNDLNNTTTDLTKYDAASKTAGPLQGDASIRQLSGQIRTGLGSILNDLPGGYKSLTQIGITVQRDGSLSLNAGKLHDALTADPKAVQALFATSATPDDSQVSYLRSSSTTPAGSYELNVSQLATQGKVVASSPVAALTIDSSNDALTVSVKGITTSVTLTHGTYADAGALATEVQSQLNGSAVLSSVGISASVAADSGGALTLSAKAYGSASKVQLLGGNAQANLFGATPTTTDGVDVAGVIGGIPGVGEGQTLTSPTGLSLQVTGGATGDRGAVHFTRGIAVKLDNLIGDALGTKGLLAERNDTFNAEIKQNAVERDRITAELAVKQARYTAQFNTLDQLISTMNSTMSYLSQQLSSLNSSTK